MLLRFPVVTSYVGFLPRDTRGVLNAAQGIGVGVLLGVVAWVVIIVVSFAAMNWF
jgi:hypothetical protein